MRRRPYLLIAAVTTLAIVAAIVFWLTTPPGVTRLLPECDALVYANLAPLRTATHFDRKPVARSAEFQQFIDATGIVPERDLDAVALAMHRIADPQGPNGPVAYSEVFAGHLDPARLERYLASIATNRESYAGHTIYSLPMGDPTPRGQRLLRVAVLGSGLVAASNAPTPEQIHAILDRHRSPFSLFGGPSLLSGLYSDVPTLASGWAIGQLGLPFADGNTLRLASLTLPLRADTTFIASVRYLGTVHLRLEAVAANPDEAATTARQLTALLSLFRSIESNRAARIDPTLQRGLDSVQAHPAKDRVLLTADLPTGLLTRLFTPEAEIPPPTQPASK